MIANSVLLRRLALLLFALGTLLGAIVFWGLSSQQETSMQRELGSRAAFITSELELFGRSHPVAEDVLLFVREFDRKALGVRRVDLVDVDKQIILATTESESESASSSVDPIENLLPAASRRMSRATGNDRVYRLVEPVSFQGTGLRSVLGNDLRLLIDLDATFLMTRSIRPRVSPLRISTESCWPKTTW